MDRRKKPKNQKRKKDMEDQNKIIHDLKRIKTKQDCILKQQNKMFQKKIELLKGGINDEKLKLLKYELNIILGNVNDIGEQIKNVKKEIKNPKKRGRENVERKCEEIGNKSKRQKII